MGQRVIECFPLRQTGPRDEVKELRVSSAHAMIFLSQQVGFLL